MLGFFLYQNLVFKVETRVVHETFCFHICYLHNNTQQNTKSNNSKFYEAWEINQEKKCLPIYHLSTFISHSIRVSQVYDQDQKSVAFSRVIK